jgi:hypothetical protein
VNCTVADAPVLSNPLTYSLEGVTAYFTARPPDTWLPSPTLTLKASIEPPPQILLTTTRTNLAQDARGVKCFVKFDKPATVVDEQVSGYQVVLDAELSKDTSPEGKAIALRNASHTPIILDSIRFDAPWGTNVIMIVVCDRPQGDSTFLLSHQIRVPAPHVRWAALPPIQAAPKQPFRAAGYIVDDTLTPFADDRKAMEDRGFLRHYQAPFSAVEQFNSTGAALHGTETEEQELLRQIGVAYDPNTVLRGLSLSALLGSPEVDNATASVANLTSILPLDPGSKDVQKAVVRLDNYTECKLVVPGVEFQGGSPIPSRTGGAARASRGFFLVEASIFAPTGTQLTGYIECKYGDRILLNTSRWRMDAIPCQKGFEPTSEGKPSQQGSLETVQRIARTGFVSSLMVPLTATL